MQRIAWIVICILGMGLMSCSSISFNRQWRSAPVRMEECAICGKWKGTWVSEVNGHHGRLRGILEQNPDGTYNARFHATYWKFFRYSTTVTLHPVPGRIGGEPDKVFLKGEADLGKVLGVYEYDGYATPEEYFIKYQSKYDHGVNRMKRAGK